MVKAWNELGFSDSTLMFFGRESTRAKPLLESWVTGGKYHIYGGYESLDEVMPLFSVYVHPSVSEGYGMTVPEAMSYGKVVVVSTGTGSSMLIEDGVNGYTFNPRDVDSIKSILVDLKNDFPCDVARKARETAENVTWSNVKRDYMRLYEEILD